MIDFTTLTGEDVAGYYRAASDEIQRRENLLCIPAQIAGLAALGRQAVEEQVMVEAVTKHPEPEPAPE